MINELSQAISSTIELEEVREMLGVIKSEMADMLLQTLHGLTNGRNGRSAPVVN